MPRSIASPDPIFSVPPTISAATASSPFARAVSIPQRVTAG
jgi:hypothetical protein